jgi:uncharacterized protein YjbI with pentapeptide repeats
LAPPGEGAAPPRLIAPPTPGTIAPAPEGKAAVADQEHEARLKEAIAKRDWAGWDAWRKANPTIRPNLTGAKLRETDLRGADLRGADLSTADLNYTLLSHANLSRANLSRADLLSADLSRANLQHATLQYADLRGAHLNDALMNRVSLSGADLFGARLFETIFTDVDLSSVIGLETCEHEGPSSIDHRTLQKSGPLPISFLRGVGLPDNLIDYLPSLLNQPIQHYSCFISYSAKDDDFAKRIHADLQKSGVRCWFAPHDLPIGEGILEGIDAAIRLRDKVLLILSEHSIESGWVKDEVNTGFEEERKRKQNVLFPVRLDEAVMDTNEAWAAKLRARNIGDFRRWKEHDAYHQSFARVLHDLTIQAPEVSSKVP